MVQQDQIVVHRGSLGIEIEAPRVIGTHYRDMSNSPAHIPHPVIRSGPPALVKMDNIAPGILSTHGPGIVNFNEFGNMSTRPLHHQSSGLSPLPHQSTNLTLAQRTPGKNQKNLTLSHPRNG
jgi:hypothetical protein